MNRQLDIQLPKANIQNKSFLIMRILLNAWISLFLVIGLLQLQPAEAATIVVDRLDDDPTATACTTSPNDCSLRGAIIAANNFSTHPGLDTITLPSGTYPLDEVGTGEAAALNGDLDIMGDLIINGGGEGTTIIDGNGTSTLEQVFTVDGSFEAEMNDLTITDGGGTGSTVGAIVAFGGLTLNNVTIDNNHGTGSAGGIYSTTNLSLTDSTISNNTGGIGGIYVHQGTLTITSSTIDGNTATSSGGGISFNSGTGTIQGNSQIQNNQAGSGGGITIFGGTLTINDSLIYMNETTTGTGGIYVSSGASVILNNTNISNNETTGASTLGGGVTVFGSFEMDGGELALNIAPYAGGGLVAYSGSTVDIYNAYINGNHVTEDPSFGGGIYNLSGQVTLDGTTVATNYVSGTASSLSKGGGIYSSGGDLTLIDSLINENDAFDSGGGVFFSSGALTVTNSIFRGNETTGTNSAGGGLFIGSSSTATVKQAEFSSNVATDNGGGIHNQGALTLENVTISGNSSGIGAGILTTGTDTTDILNSTISSNSVPSGTSSGGLVAYNSVTIKNSIVSGNDNDECLNHSGSAITSNGYNISSDNTCGFSGTGDQVNTDPLLGALADNGGFTKTHLLTPGSPAIDTGTNTGCPATDQRGLSRPQDGDDNSSEVCDIGAYERIGISFSDVPRTHWAFGYIGAIAEAGLTAGNPDGTYGPASLVNRAQMAVFLLKGIHGESYTPPTPDGSHPFSDIGGHWAESWIEQLYDEGITAGFPDNTYRPADYVNRAQMAVMLLVAKHGSGYTPPVVNGSHPFTDISGHWAEAWIEQLYDEGITAGYPDGTYRPGDNVNRAQMAVFLVATFGLTVY